MAIAKKEKAETPSVDIHAELDKLSVTCTVKAKFPGIGAAEQLSEVAGEPVGPMAKPGGSSPAMTDQV